VKILKQQHFDVDFFEFDHKGVKYRLGIGNYKDSDSGCEMFFPESGSDYILVIYNNGWYKFELKEFITDVGVDYISEKLKCCTTESKVIIDFIRMNLKLEASKILLSGKSAERNPFV